MSRDSVLMIVKVFAKQVSKKYARKFSKVQKNLQNGKKLTSMTSSIRVMTSSLPEPHFSKIFVVTPTFMQKIIVLAYLVFEIDRGANMLPPTPV